jgi:hypothetical protein
VRRELQQVEGDKRKAAAAAAAQRQAAGGGWFGWFRGSPAAKPDEAQEPAPDGELSEEEKQHLRQLVNEQEEALDMGENRFCRLQASSAHRRLQVVLQDRLDHPFEVLA